MAAANIHSYSSNELVIKFSNTVSVTMGANVEIATATDVTLTAYLKVNGDPICSDQKTIPTYSSMPVNLSSQGITLKGTITAHNFFTTTVYSFDGTCTASDTQSIAITGYLAGFTITG